MTNIIPTKRDIVDATKRVLRFSDGEIQPPHVRQMLLPERLSGFGLVHYSEMHANACVDRSSERTLPADASLLRCGLYVTYRTYCLLYTSPSPRD